MDRLNATGLACSFAMFLMLCSTTTNAEQENRIKVPFMFTEDQRLEQTDLRKAIPPSQELHDDGYLNAPMTRLEYMLAKLDQELQSQPHLSEIKSYLSEGFHPNTKKYTAVNVSSFVRYSRSTGRITVGYKIQDLGPPKKPIRISCDDILGMLTGSAPQRPLGYLYHHTVLGVLAQEELDVYTPQMTKIAQHVVHRVILESDSDDSRTMYGLVCQRTAADAPVRYERYSFKRS